MKFTTNIPRCNLTVVCEPRTVTVINGKRIMDPGVSVQFVDGVYLTNNQEEIKLLKKNPAFGRDFIEAPAVGADVVDGPHPKASAAAPKPKKKPKKR